MRSYLLATFLDKVSISGVNSKALSKELANDSANVLQLVRELELETMLCALTREDGLLVCSLL